MKRESDCRVSHSERVKRVSSPPVAATALTLPVVGFLGSEGTGAGLIDGAGAGAREMGFEASSRFF